MNKTILDIDIETESLSSDKEDALNPHKNRITVIGVKSQNSDVQIYRDLEIFKKEIWLAPEFMFSGHNFKWDFKVLTHHLGGLPANGYESYAEDTRLMAYVCTDKVSEAFLAEYEEERKRLNKKLPPGINHREAGLHSLKTLAPYFLGVPAFWEDPSNHNNDEYLTKDVIYTQQLRLYFSSVLKELNQYDFYLNKAMPWARTLLKAEVTGINFDLKKLAEMEISYGKKELILKEKISEQWKEAFEAYKTREKLALQNKYQEMFNKAYNKPSKKPKNIEGLQAKYSSLYNKAEANADFKFNLDSPSQMKWLLKDYFNYDIKTFEGNESTGVEVLERLAKEVPEIKTLLEYRETSKILTGFFPTYRTEEHKGKIHSTFSFDGTKTGRVSCTRPNLHQTPKNLKELFVAGENKVFITKDLSAIEPCIIGYFSKDPVFCDIIFDKRSFHDVNTVKFFSKFMDSPVRESEVKKYYPELRFISKTVFLGILYGAGWRRVKAEAQAQGYILSDSDCKNIVYNIRDEYKEVWSFKKELDRELESGAIIYNLFGRPFKIDNPDDVYMKGFNRLIQGSASDLTMQAATDIERESGCLPLAFIHDSIITEVDEKGSEEKEKLIEYHFTKFELPVGNKLLPLTVDGGISNKWE